MGRGILMLSAADVYAVIGAAECVDAVEDVLRRWALGEVAPPEVLGVHVENGGFHIKAGTMRRGRAYFAVKTNGNFPANPERHGLPSIQGLVVLADAADGTPLAVMDSASLTQLRTAAATGVAARWLSRDVTSVVALVGCGAQAPSQLRALAAVRSLARITVVDRDPARAHTLAAHMSQELGIPITVGASVRDAAGDCDICVTSTTSRSPILDTGMVPPGTFVAAVGADHPEKNEISGALMSASKVVVDSLRQARGIGDLHHAITSGAMREEDVHAELGAVVAGLAPGRTDPEEVIVFDSTGTGLQDVASAALAYERAVAQGRGRWLELATGGA